MSVLFSRVRFRAYQADEDETFDPLAPPPPPAALATYFDNVIIADSGGTKFSADFTSSIVPPFAVADAALASGDTPLSISAGQMVAVSSDSYADSPNVSTSGMPLTFSCDMTFSAAALDTATGLAGGGSFGPDLFDVLMGTDAFSPGGVCMGCFLDWDGTDWRIGTDFNPDSGSYRIGDPIVAGTTYTIVYTFVTHPHFAGLAQGTVSINGVDTGLTWTLNPPGTDPQVRVGYWGGIGP